MTRDELIAGFEQRYCKPLVRTDYYSSNLIRCGCGKHPVMAVVCGESAGEVVKLFGGALSSHLKTGGSGPFTFVVAKDAGDHWKGAVHAIQMLLERRSREGRAEAVTVDLLADFGPVQALLDQDLADDRWVDAMLDPARRSLPRVAEELSSAAAVPTFRWYRSVTGSDWSGRIEGLQVCTLSSGGRRLTFAVGSTGTEGDSGARSKFCEIMRREETRLGPLVADELVFSPVDVARASHALRTLHQGRIAEHGSPEHRLESCVLAGSVKLVVGDRALVPVMKEYPLQFPARWWPGGRARYVDVIARDGDVPWVVELKVELGQGAYYRDGIVQVALYREYVLRSKRLDAWFGAHGLDRSACRAALVIPPLRGDDAQTLRADHRAVAAWLGVELVEDAAAARFSG